jgi:hypothetical protein
MWRILRNRTRKQLFAGSGFPQEQDCCIKLGNLVDFVQGIFENGTLPNNVVKIVLGFNLFP